MLRKYKLKIIFNYINYLKFSHYFYLIDLLNHFINAKLRKKYNIKTIIVKYLNYIFNKRCFTYWTLYFKLLYYIFYNIHFINVTLWRFLIVA